MPGDAAILLDIRTLLIILTLGNVVQASVLTYVWRTHQKVAYARLWGLGSSLLALGALLIFFRNLLPGWGAVLVSNALLTPGWMLLKFGIALAAGKSPPWRLGWAVCALSMAGAAWYALVEPSLSARVVVFTAASVLLDLVVVQACLTCKEAALAGLMRTIGLLTILLDVSLIWRAVGAVQTSLESLFTADLSQLQFYLVSTVVSSALTALLALVTSEKYKQELFALSRHDALTGAANRLALEETVAKEWPRALRHGHPVALVMFDLDNFKAFNDTHGHQAGDQALKAFSDTAAGLLRQEDTWCRLGGEEFAALLPETGVPQATAIAERIRQGVESLPLSGSAEPLHVSVSAGVAGCVPPNLHFDQLLELADRMLYQAKQSGRNRVEAAETARDADREKA